MSSFHQGDTDRLAAATVAYVGHGSRRTPGTNGGAVLALDPVDGARLLDEVKQILRATDTLHIPLEAFGNQEKSILFGAEFERIWPGLSREALDVLAWRWAYLEHF